MVEKEYGVAIDIGTTTIVMSVIDLETAAEIATVSAFNSQKTFGDDVLTRITYEYRFGETAIVNLQRLVVGGVNELLRQVCEKAGITQTHIKKIAVAANCIMAHMFLGKDARGMGVSPYHPEFLEAQTVSAKEVGILAGENTKIYVAPQVSAFLGGDVVAGICQNDLQEKKGVTLYIDIGTNGEIVLNNRGHMIACSCAVGPALEGANISCGMLAIKGAIEDVRVESKGLTLKVIGNVAPKGMCGSGVLSIVRELLRTGKLDATGRFVDGSDAFVVCSNPRILITQKDIRQVQLAKAAILAAITILLQQEGVEARDIEQVYVAGQFGAHLSEEILTDIGFLPKEVCGKISYVGNASKSGAKKALLDEAARAQMENMAKEIQYIELSETDGYMKAFMDSMNLQ